MKRLWQKWLKADHGNIGVTAAIAAVPVMIAAGAPVDFIRAQDRATEAQNALDLSLLGATANPAGFTSDGVRSAFVANFTVPDTQLVSFATSKQSDGTYLSVAKLQMKTSLMSLAGISTLDFSVQAQTKPITSTMIDKVTFTPVSAKGAFDKEIFFFTKDKNGKIVKETQVLDYDYNGASGYAGKVKTESGGYTESLTAGAYGSWGLSMIVYEDLSYMGKHINPKKYFSDDKTASTWTKSTGQCTDAGGQQSQWEDGGDGDFKDFVFKLTCTTTTTSTGEVRLIR